MTVLIELNLIFKVLHNLVARQVIMDCDVDTRLKLTIVRVLLGAQDRTKVKTSVQIAPSKL